MSSVSSRITVIADLLLGAAFADKTMEGREEATVRKLLGELLGNAELPADVDTRIKKFDAKAFNLAAAAKDFAQDPPIQKRKLLELVAAIRDADDEIDLDEDEYLRTLGLAIGLKAAEFADLTLDIEIEDLKQNLKSLRSIPPPTPAKK